MKESKPVFGSLYLEILFKPSRFLETFSEKSIYLFMSLVARKQNSFEVRFAKLCF